MFWLTSGFRVSCSASSHIESLTYNPSLDLLGLPILKALSDRDVRPKMIPRVIRGVRQELTDCLLRNDQSVFFDGVLSHVRNPCLQRPFFRRLHRKSRNSREPIQQRPTKPRSRLLLFSHRGFLALLRRGAENITKNSYVKLRILRHKPIKNQRTRTLPRSVRRSQ